MKDLSFLHLCVSSKSRIVILGTSGRLQTNLRHDLAHAFLINLTQVIPKDRIHLFQALVARLWNQEPHPQEHEETE